MKKIILSDCDGVLLYWNDGFTQYMQSFGFVPVPDSDTAYNLSERYGLPRDVISEKVHEYNNSDYIRHLKPFRDSLEYVSKLKDDGFIFNIITSVGSSDTVYENRRHNLDAVFGGGFYDNLICIPVGHSKLEYLREWSDSGYFWIEDHVENALDGKSVGLEPIIIDAAYNQYGDGFTRVSNETPWREIYNIIRKRYDY